MHRKRLQHRAAKSEQSPLSRGALGVQHNFSLRVLLHRINHTAQSAPQEKIALVTQVQKSLRTRSNGFTIIELIIAMAFLSFLLLFCVFATLQVLRMYNKGLTIKQMTQTGRTLSEEILRTARTAQSGRIQFNKAAGRLCLGDTAYVWNDTTPAMTGGSTTNNLDGEQVNVIRLNDPAQNTCTNLADRSFTAGSPDNSVRLTSNQVRILDMNVEPNDKLIRFRFVLGSYSTADATMIPQLTGGQWQCSTGIGGNFCAFAEFSTIAYLLNE